MRYLDMNTYKRKKHFDYFTTLDYPHFNLTANVDITRFIEHIKSENKPFFLSTLFVVVKTANSISEFKQRIRDNKIVEHDNIDPSFTIMSDDNVFSFCNSKYFDDYNKFIAYSLQSIEKTKKEVVLDDEPGKDNVMYVTSIPWISFTNITHPIHLSPIDSVPRFAWGKYFESEGKILMPLSVQVHHALMDGYHVGRYFEIIQGLFDIPESIFQ